jgi:hypothetical protein
MQKLVTSYGLKAAGFAACITLLAGVFAKLDAFSDAKAADTGYELQTIVPQWNDKGELLLPKDFREWVFIGAPLTPNGLNDGKANFPEFHNVYVQPEAFKAYRKNGKWPTGTMMVKELQLVDDPKGEFPDGSRFEPSGRGYFPGPVNGVDVSVKDPKRFPDSKGWGYFNFNHKAPPYLKSTAAKPVEECASCHIANADEDMVYMKLYRPIVTPLPE